MRASRLLAILEMLQVRGLLTAADLARELGVSERTVYRDLAGLAAAGIPVRGERGEGGGYRLADGFRADRFGAFPTGPAAELGLGALLAATRLKAAAGVPGTMDALLARAGQRLYPHGGGWIHSSARNRRHLQVIAGAVWDDRRLHLTYRDGRAALRTVDPLGLVHEAGSWYLVAAQGGIPGVFGIDRIVEVERTQIPASRPDGFDLAGFWSSRKRAGGTRRQGFATKVRLGPLAQRYRDGLGALSPASSQDHVTDADGWIRQTLLFDDRRLAVAALLALSPHVEILEPASLRDDLAGIAEQIIERV